MERKSRRSTLNRFLFPQLHQRRHTATLTPTAVSRTTNLLQQLLLATTTAVFLVILFIETMRELSTYRTEQAASSGCASALYMEGPHLESQPGHRHY